MITSTSNPRIKQIRALNGRPKERRDAGLFVIEGVRLCEEALAAGFLPEIVLHVEELDPRASALLDAFKAKGVDSEVVTDDVMGAASDTQTPQGILAVLPLRALPRPKQLDFVLVADQVRDPGNLGTLLRSAAAAGVQAVWLHPGTADAYSPKVVRSAMGAHFRLSIEMLGYEDIRRSCTMQGLRLLLAAVGQGDAYDAADLRGPLALVVGSEAEGPGAGLTAAADGFVHIPMPGGFESLNAAVAGSILMFEVVRQRRV
ncbi:MAG: RNA methyltransferase [Anaerolineae bacterium]|nr:MAG: RNA methyltransferase [Anaerolineae bacterium]